ncbi:hypothetical protein HDU98_011362 [Podochytrium sp. JEL0797]|nr:hypothetical protein HDU98_011362 [Podochytrium sp. JEL0797]
MLTLRQKAERLTRQFRAKLMLAFGRKKKETLLTERRGLLCEHFAMMHVEHDDHRLFTTDADSMLDDNDSLNDLCADYTPATPNPKLPAAQLAFPSPPADTDIWSLASTSIADVSLPSPLSFRSPQQPIVVAASARDSISSSDSRKKSKRKSNDLTAPSTPSSSSSSLKRPQYSTPSPSPQAQTLQQQQQLQQLSQPHLVPNHRKQHLVKSKIQSSNDLKTGRMKDFFRHGVLRHSERVLKNRGLWLPPVDSSGGGKWNLGNMLHITDKYTSDLDVDTNQFVPQPSCITAVLPSQGNNTVEIQTLHVNDTKNLFDRDLFDSAQKLVCEQFAKKNVNADLEGVLDDDFTVDVVTDPLSHQVLGAVEYVFMKKYLWIDAIAVREDLRGLRIGRVMMERLQHVASIRSKQLLCFGLHDVCGWYLKQGFEVAKEFPELPWHIGKFLVWKPVVA